MPKSRNVRKNGEKKTRFQKVHKNAPEIMLNVISAEPEISKFDRLAMFYRGAFENNISYMDALDTETGEKVAILVGFDINEEGLIETFPLARILEKEDISRYKEIEGSKAWQM